MGPDERGGSAIIDDEALVVAEESDPGLRRRASVIRGLPYRVGEAAPGSRCWAALARTPRGFAKWQTQDRARWSDKPKRTKRNRMPITYIYVNLRLAVTHPESTCY
jgi:hypothetical protein